MLWCEVRANQGLAKSRVYETLWRPETGFLMLRLLMGIIEVSDKLRFSSDPLPVQEFGALIIKVLGINLHSFTRFICSSLLVIHAEGFLQPAECTLFLLERAICSPGSALRGDGACVILRVGYIAQHAHTTKP